MFAGVWEGLGTRLSIGADIKTMGPDIKVQVYLLGCISGSKRIVIQSPAAQK